VRISSVTFASTPLLNALVERAIALPIPTFLVIVLYALLPLQPTVEDVSKSYNSTATPDDGPVTPLNNDDVALSKQGLSH
jgi:hypothetical protein